MLRARKIDHLVLRTAQASRMMQFYSYVFGAKIVREDEKSGLVQLKMGDFLVDLLATEFDREATKQGSPRPGVLDHFCIEVEPMSMDEFDALAAYLDQDLSPRRLHGAKGFGPSVVVTDPDGNRIEIKFYDDASGEA